MFIDAEAEMSGTDHSEDDQPTFSGATDFIDDEPLSSSQKIMPLLTTPRRSDFSRISSPLPMLVDPVQSS